LVFILVTGGGRGDPHPLPFGGGVEVGVGVGVGVGVALGVGAGTGVGAGIAGIATVNTPELGVCVGWVGSSSVIEWHPIRMKAAPATPRAVLFITTLT
jgi:hypothetical protein